MPIEFHCIVLQKIFCGISIRKNNGYPKLISLSNCLKKILIRYFVDFLYMIVNIVLFYGDQYFEYFLSPLLVWIIVNKIFFIKLTNFFSFFICIAFHLILKKFIISDYFDCNIIISIYYQITSYSKNILFILNIFVLIQVDILFSNLQMIVNIVE